MLANFTVIIFWTIVVLGVSQYIINRLKLAINYVKKLHKIPCSNCQYFTNNYYLKCTVNPQIALHEEAIYCREFKAKSNFDLEKFTNN